MIREIIFTQDGSPSFWVPQLGETYHSRFGAVQESRHVYVEAGLKPLLEKYDEIAILEIGFGAGLNCLLSLEESIRYEKHIFYETLEPYPLSENEIRILDDGFTKDHLKAARFFEDLHFSIWNQPVSITPFFTLLKNSSKLEEFATDRFFRLVYFDAFSPTVQPELWTEVIFTKIFGLMEPGGILTSYCSRGFVRRNMQASGFKVEKLPGPPGKKEITRAWKI